MEIQRDNFLPLPPSFSIFITTSWAAVEPGPELWVSGRAGSELVLLGHLFYWAAYQLWCSHGQYVHWVVSLALEWSPGCPG